MKTPWFRAALVLAAVCGVSACTSLPVTSDVNPALAGAVQCHTFAWSGTFRGDTPLRSTIANPINEARLRTAIGSHLASLGIQEVASNPDCLVGYGIGTRQVVEGAYPYGWGYGAGWGWGPGPWGWGGWGGWGPYVYHEVIIAVDLFDARSRQPIWHAYVPQSLSGLTGAQAEKSINAAVGAIFTKYPGHGAAS